MRIFTGTFWSFAFYVLICTVLVGCGGDTSSPRHNGSGDLAVNPGGQQTVFDVMNGTNSQSQSEVAQEVTGEQVIVEVRGGGGTNQPCLRRFESFTIEETARAPQGWTIVGDSKRTRTFQVEGYDPSTNKVSLVEPGQSHIFAANLNIQTTFSWSAVAPWGEAVNFNGSGYFLSFIGLTSDQYCFHITQQSVELNPTDY